MSHGKENKKQMREAKKKLKEKLWLELESKVAKHMNIPGR